MDLSTMIVDMLMKGKDEKALAPFPRGDETTAALRAPAEMAEMDAGVAELSVPGYAAYKREALVNGEQVLSPAEFKKLQSQGP